MYFKLWLSHNKFFVMFLCILLIEYFLNPSPTETHDDIKFEMHKTVFGQNVLHIQL